MGSGVIGLVAGCVGALVGAVGIAVWLRGRAAVAYERGRGEALAERAALEARLVRLPELEQAVHAERARGEAQQHRAEGLAARAAELEAQLTQERNSAREKLALLTEARTELSNAFEALSAAALKSNNQAFLSLAKTSLDGLRKQAAGDLEARQEAIGHMVAPLRDSLDKVDATVRSLEQQRGKAYGSLTQQLHALGEAQAGLQRETQGLAHALRAPTVRGRWGEIQLRNVVEMAGMVAQCDFLEQASKATDEGRLMPDLVVKLPGGRHVVVDAKAPLGAYLEATEAADEDRRVACLQAHAKQLRRHMLRLSAKEYWRQFEPTPEFVVMFLPGEAFFSAALQQEPELVELGGHKRVILATPTTLLALLRAVAYGWQTEGVARNAQEISSLGKELYQRLGSLARHLGGLRKGLDAAVRSYNQAVGSFEGRVLVTARRFHELGAAAGDPIEAPAVIDRAARPVAPAARRTTPQEDNSKPVQGELISLSGS